VQEINTFFVIQLFLVEIGLVTQWIQTPALQ